MRLALIAGQGQLPAALAARIAQAPLVCALQGFMPAKLAVDLVFRLETLGSFVQQLQQRGITHLCMCGAIRRPTIDPAAIDDATLPLVPVLQQALAAGDDGALRAVIGLFQDSGITVLGAHQLAPDLLMPAGCPTRAQPSAAQRADLALALQVLDEQGAADLGQACVIGAGQVWAREGEAGTDAMLAALQGRGQGAVLHKAPKPGQDLRADLPTIGPDTVAAAAAAGLSGIALQAGAVMVLDQDQVLASLDQAGLFLWLR